MKNLLFNVFKTLFFFDLAVYIFTVLPDASGSDSALLKLKQEAIILAVPLGLTLIFFFIVERCKIGVPLNKHVFKAFGVGLFYGIIPLGIVVGVLCVLKNLKITGIEKPENLGIWLAAILCNTLAAELLLRGYLFNLFKKCHGFIFSAIVTTALFISLDIKLLQESKIYIANIIILNLLLCLILDSTDSTISSVTARFCYTTLSCLLFGSMGLTGGYPTLLKFEIAGKRLQTGGEYGFEGSFITLIVLSAFALTHLICRYRPIKSLKAYFKNRKIKN